MRPRSRRAACRSSRAAVRACAWTATAILLTECAGDEHESLYVTAIRLHPARGVGVAHHPRVRPARADRHAGAKPDRHLRVLSARPGPDPGAGHGRPAVD